MPSTVIYRRYHGGGALNPLALAPELYLSAASGMGLDAVADAATVLPWPDQSGVAENRDANVVPGGSTAPVMRRTGVHAAPGGPAVQFNGTTSGLFCSTLTTSVSFANGACVVAYGRMDGSLNGPCFDSTLWSDGTSHLRCKTTTPGGGGACGTAGDFSPGWQDFLGDHSAQSDNIFTPGSVFGLWAWNFPGTPGGTVSGQAWTPTQQPRFSAAWNASMWQASVSESYTLGVGKQSSSWCQTDLCALLVYSKPLTPAQLAGIRLFFQRQFG